MLGSIKQEKSSWFSGYNKFYYNTNGYIYSKLYKKMAIFAIVRKAIKTRINKTSDYSVLKLIKYMTEGMNDERKHR